MEQNTDVLRFKAYVEQVYRMTLDSIAQVVIDTLPLNTQWKKVYRATLPIVLLTPQTGRVKQLLLRAKACILRRPLLYQATLNPDLLLRMYERYRIAHIAFGVFLPSGIEHTIHQLYYTQRSSVSILQPRNSRYDYIVTVAKKGIKGEVPSVKLLINLSAHKAALTFLVPYRHTLHSNVGLHPSDSQP